MDNQEFEDKAKKYVTRMQDLLKEERYHENKLKDIRQELEQLDKEYIALLRLHKDRI